MPNRPRGAAAPDPTLVDVHVLLPRWLLEACERRAAALQRSGVSLTRVTRADVVRGALAEAARGWDAGEPDGDASPPGR
jgi:hypothetical protein